MKTQAYMAPVYSPTAQTAQPLKAQRSGGQVGYLATKGQQPS